MSASSGPQHSGEAHGALVFTDLAGFTAFTAERGDPAALALVERFEAIARSLLPPGARVVKQLGDGLFLFFAAAATAIPTALNLSHDCATASRPEEPLWVRTGVHVGTALLRGEDLIGHDVNVAARITDVAAAGEVLVSDAARRCEGLPPRLRFEPLGPVYVKGMSDPLRLFRASVNGTT